LRALQVKSSDDVLEKQASDHVLAPEKFSLQFRIVWIHRTQTCQNQVCETLELLDVCNLTISNSQEKCKSPQKQRKQDHWEECDSPESFVNFENFVLHSEQKLLVVMPHVHHLQILGSHIVALKFHWFFPISTVYEIAEEIANNGVNQLSEFHVVDHLEQFFEHDNEIVCAYHQHAYGEHVDSLEEILSHISHEKSFVEQVQGNEQQWQSWNFPNHIFLLHYTESK
jgi:hypothetical protein